MSSSERVAEYLHRADDARAHAWQSKRYSKRWQEIASAYEKMALEIATSAAEPPASNVIAFPGSRVKRSN
jgi:hypothetical protein